MEVCEAWTWPTYEMQIVCDCGICCCEGKSNLHRNPDYESSRLSTPYSSFIDDIVYCIAFHFGSAIESRFRLWNRVCILPRSTRVPTHRRVCIYMLQIGQIVFLDSRNRIQKWPIEIVHFWDHHCVLHRLSLWGWMRQTLILYWKLVWGGVAKYLQDETQPRMQNEPQCEERNHWSDILPENMLEHTAITVAQKNFNWWWDLFHIMT